MRAIQAVFLGAICILVAAAWQFREPLTGLRRMAADAKAEGKRSISSRDIICPVEGNLGELAQSFSVVVARPSRLAVMQTHDDRLILTWDVFRDAQILSKVDPQQDECRVSLPRGLRLEPGEIAMTRAGGTATIAGVQVTIGASNVWTPAIARRPSRCCLAGFSKNTGRTPRAASREC